MFSYSSFTKKTVDNTIREKEDRIKMDQELVNLLRVRLDSVISDLDDFPEETKDMNFGELFVWVDYKDSPMDEDARLKLQEGFGKVFEAHDDGLMLRLFSKNREIMKVIYDPHNRFFGTNALRTGVGDLYLKDQYTVILPSIDSDNVTVVLDMLKLK